MNIIGQVIPHGTALVRRVAASLSPDARRRLAWMDFYERHGRNARLTCRHFGLSPDVFYRWRRRYDPRQPQTPPEVVIRIRALREQYPRWGKAKLAVLLQREGIRLSASTVGRVLQRLKRSGQLREPRTFRRGRSWPRRPHAQRLPKGYAVRAPGDLVQVDTLDVLILPGLRRKQFTARDMISRYDVAEAYGRATAHTATAFLALLRQRMPFPVRALQIDGGSEFRGAFEEACAAAGLPLFVVPPHSPRLQSHVERAQRTYREEFYTVVDVDPELTAHRAQLQEWVQIYNTVRPHQHLRYRTPQEYCEAYFAGKG